MNMIFDAREYLEKFRIRASVQRIAIMDFLIKNRIHPTAEDIYNALATQIPTLSRTTVYNTLKLFEEGGALMSLSIDERNVRFDVDTSRHAHGKCLKCGKVYDLPVRDIEKIEIPECPAFSVTEMHLYYKGYCQECGKISPVK